ncbi:aspartyl protease family protein [Methylomonas fluvii]|uniref:Aspartyl protease family protein n=1 Tax=Methylomonas fluvii TaxID=1854564 RepID=A0ABR9D9Q5_9GAMM|nr:aspartyl protease family protein [Methylomonas fluvii]MBD9359680.1 aspartyl protease family protein [Methylomonas fluvii]
MCINSSAVILKLTNLFNCKQVDIDALVDTGATFMCVTEEIALQLGFHITEVSRQVVTLAGVDSQSATSELSCSTG